MGWGIYVSSYYGNKGLLQNKSLPNIKPTVLGCVAMGGWKDIKTMQAYIRKAGVEG